ncbi:Uncharacterized protein SCF082_LOCUS31115, partial [Durusdinium trenchii]
RRPAAADPPDGGWEKASEVNIRELNSWPAIYIQGQYWDNDAEVIGEMKSLAVGDDGTMLTVKAHGTTSEELLRLLSGRASKVLQVHLCDDPCSHLVWKEGLIHAQRLKKCQFEDLPWSRNAEVSVREAERDEMEVLRKEAAERGKGVGAGLGAPGAAAEEAVREAQKEEKEPSSKKKKKKKKKAKERMTPVKSLEAIFGTTGLDPKEEVRRKLRRKAKHLSRKAKSRKSSSNSSSSDSSSGSSTMEEGPTEELFSPVSAPQRIWRRFPGVLTSTMILEAQRVMLLQLGAGLHEAETRSLRPIVSQYCRQHLMASMAPPVAREALHWSAVIDLILEGRVASAMDVMTQRLKSLEGLSKSMRPDLLRQLELLPLDRGGLATSSEVQMAGQAANHEAKVLQKSTTRPWEERQKGKEKGEKGKWKSSKGDNKTNEFDKNKKEKGDGKKKPLAHFALSSGERGHEFDSPGKVATLNDGEPLDLTAFNSPEGGAKLMTEEAEPGEAHVSEDSTIRGIFERAVEVLRQDGHLQSRRSNTEFDLGSQCPPFPLRIRTEGWGKRLNFPHLPHFDELVNGTMAALNHLAGFEGTLTPSPEDHTSSAASPETSVRALAEKRLYWTSWECYESPGVSWHEGDEEGWEAYDIAVLEAQVDSKALLLP